MLQAMVALESAVNVRRTMGYVAIGIALAACALALRTGTPMGIAAAATAALLVPCFYLTFARPLIFPYGLYILLIPFDNILGIGDANVTVTRLLGIFAGVAVLAWCFRKGIAVRPSWTLVALLVLYLWMGMTAFWASDQHAAVQYLREYAGLFLLFTALAVVPLNFKDFKVLLALSVIGGIAAAAYGIYTFYHNPALASQTLENQRLFASATGPPALDPNAFADALLLPAAALMMFVLREARMSMKLLYGAGLALIAAAMLLSGSREAAVALVIMTLYFAVRSRYKVELSFVIAGFIVLCVSVPSALWVRFALGTQRTSIWAVAGDAFSHNWLHGYGIGSFVDAYNAYYLRVEQVYPNGWSSAPHNLVAHYAVELGIIGIVLIAAFFYSSIRDLRAIGRESPMYDYRVLVEAALIGLIVVAMFIDLFTYKYAWLTLALAAQLRSAALQFRQPRTEPIHDRVTPIHAVDERTPAFGPTPARLSLERSDTPQRLH